MQMQAQLYLSFISISSWNTLAFINIYVIKESHQSILAFGLFITTKKIKNIRNAK